MAINNTTDKQPISRYVNIDVPTKTLAEALTISQAKVTETLETIYGVGNVVEV